MTFTADDLTGAEVEHIGSNTDDFSNKFVADNHWNRNGFLSPVIPVVNVQVGSADSSFMDFYENIIDAGFRVGDILKPKSGF